MSVLKYPERSKLREMYVALGVCPYCRKELSEIRTNGRDRWRHCYSCHFDFEEPGNHDPEEAQEEAREQLPERGPE